MSNYRSFIRGNAALESLTIGLTSQREQIEHNRTAGYDIQAQHLFRERRIAEISGAFEHLDSDRYPAYRAVFSQTVRAIEFPHQLPELASNDRLSAANSLAFAPTTSKGSPAERSNIEIWSTLGDEHLIVGVVDFGELSKGYFLISQWSEGKLSSEKDILKAYQAMTPRAPKKPREPKVIKVDLLNVGKGSLAITGTLCFIVGIGAAVAFILHVTGGDELPGPGPTHTSTITVCNIIKTRQTYVIDTPDGPFIRDIKRYVHVSGSGSSGGGKGGGPKGGYGGGGGGHTKIVTNPMPVKGMTYKIRWEELGENIIRSMERSEQEGSGCGS